MRLSVDEASRTEAPVQTRRIRNLPSPQAGPRTNTRNTAIGASRPSPFSAGELPTLHAVDHRMGPSSLQILPIRKAPHAGALKAPGPPPRSRARSTPYPSVPEAPALRLPALSARPPPPPALATRRQRKLIHQLQHPPTSMLARSLRASVPRRTLTEHLFTRQQTSSPFAFYRTVGERRRPIASGNDVSANEGQTPTSSPARTMSSQPAHNTLLIPGPIEFDDAVLQSMSHFRFGGPNFTSAPRSHTG